MAHPGTGREWYRLLYFPQNILLYETSITGIERPAKDSCPVAQPGDFTVISIAQITSS